MEPQYTELLFVYGTLAEETIQQELFKRIVPTEGDALKGYVKNTIRLPDIPEGNKYPIIKFTDNLEDKVEGHVLKITRTKLTTTDTYEGKAYLRKKEKLESGTKAWCYVAH